MHVNDTFGTAMSKGINFLMPKFSMPYTIAEEIAYDPAAHDLSVEVAKAKASNPDALLVVSRLNDAMLITRELVKQRWTPQAILSMGPGWYEDQYFKTLGKLSDGPLSFVPWYDPNKKLAQQLEAALAKAYPGVNLNTNHVFTFEALLVAADAYKRAGSTDPKALADAIRTTNITDNVSIGGGIQFNAKGQNDKVKDGAIQNRGGKLVVIAPQAAANAKPGMAAQAISGPRLSSSVPFEVYLNVAVGGVLTGLVYGLMALGLSVIFGVVRVVNFAHGEMMSIAMFLAVVLFSAFHLDPLIMMVPIAAVMFVFGYALQSGLINPFITRPEHSQFLLLVALAIIIVNVLLIVFGPDARTVQTAYAFDSFQLGPLLVDATKVYAGAAAIVFAALLFAFFRYTLIGKAIRACADNYTGALVVGLNVNRLYALTFGIGAACVGAAGAMMTLIVDVTPMIGPTYTLLAFVIVITGGLGSMPGALLGGVLIGLTEALAGLLFTPSAKSMFAFGILVLVLLFRPQGILGKRPA